MENVESIANVCDGYDTVLADSQRPKIPKPKFLI
jgi:hypothetical protein